MIKIESDSNMAEGVSNLFTGMSRSAMYRSVKLIRDLQLSSPKWDKMVCYQGINPAGELQPAIYFYDSTSVNGLEIPVDIDEPGSGGGPGTTANSTPPPMAPPPLG